MHFTLPKNKLIGMSKKCGGLDLNGIQLKWIIVTHSNWKNQNPWSRFGATWKTALPIQPIYRENGPNGLNWQCSLAGGSKAAPKILIFFYCHVCQTFILAKIHCYLSPQKSWHNNLFLTGEAAQTFLIP